MKKLVILFFLLIILTGCNKEITKEMINEQIIEEIKKCKEAGLTYRSHLNSNGMTVNIVCEDMDKDDPWSIQKRICEDKGGIPIRSGWSGQIKECRMIK